MEIENKVKAYRLIGYAAITFSTLAVISMTITLPMVYNYIYSVRRQATSELNECRVSNILLSRVVNAKNFQFVCSSVHNSLKC